MTGIYLVLLVIAIMSIIAFIVLKNDLKAMVYQLPRVASDYKAKIDPICMGGQDEDFKVLPPPPALVVIKMDNCEKVSTKMITRGIEGAVMDVLTGFIGSGLNLLVTLVANDPNPNDILDQYKKANEAASEVMSTIYAEGEGNYIRVPVDIDKHIVISGKIKDKSSGKYLKETAVTDFVIQQAVTGEQQLHTTYDFLNNGLASFFVSVDDKPYADANFGSEKTPSFIMIGNVTKVFLRPDHGKRVLDDIKRQVKRQCDMLKKSASGAELTQITATCDDFLTEMADEYYLIKDQNVVDEANGIDPWNTVYEYFGGGMNSRFSQICAIQQSIPSEAVNFCNWHAELGAKLSSIDANLQTATEGWTRMRAARAQVNELVRGAYVTKASASDPDPLKALTDYGECIATELDVTGAGGVVVHQIIPSCAFQVNCQREDLVAMNYKDSCMVQLINIADVTGAGDTNYMLVDALPGSPIDYPTAVGLGSSLGNGLMTSIPGIGGALSGIMPLTGSRCNGFNKSQLVFCVEAEEGCGAADINCRFCYTFTCNADVVTTPEPKFGVTIDHTADQILFRGYFLPL